MLAGVHSSEQVANYFRFQVNANSRSQAMQGVLAQANVSPVLIVVAAKALKVRGARVCPRMVGSCCCMWCMFHIGA